MLTEDGELQPVAADTPEARISGIFCNQCGTANHAHSRFCRTCGQSLDDQVIEDSELTSYVSGRKAKRSELLGAAMQPRAAAVNGWSVFLEVMTLLVVSGMVVATSLTHQAWGIVPILIAWVLVEMARHRVFGDKQN